MPAELPPLTDKTGIRDRADPSLFGRRRQYSDLEKNARAAALLVAVEERLAARPHIVFDPEIHTRWIKNGVRHIFFGEVMFDETAGLEVYSSLGSSGNDFFQTVQERGRLFAQAHQLKSTWKNSRPVVGRRKEFHQTALQIFAAIPLALAPEFGQVPGQN